VERGQPTTTTDTGKGERKGGKNKIIIIKKKIQHSMARNSIDADCQVPKGTKKL